ncbi:MAG: TonB family protein [Deltaproteobacteria bacterium]|nr:TonB family protein [Deltaproteobacteria bacterium]
MKTSLIVSVLIILITGIASSAIGQPELVCVENGVERKIEGVEKTKPYYNENGEKKYFTGEGQCFLRKKDDDFLSWGYALTDYIVKSNKEGILYAFVRIDDTSRKEAWGRINPEFLPKLWDEDVIDNAVCFLAWYEPGAGLIRVSEFGVFNYTKGESFRAYFGVEIESKEKKGIPVIFFWKDKTLIPPKTAGTDDDNIIRSMISGNTEHIENSDTKRLDKIEDRIGNKIIHYAAAFGDTEILKSLIAKGIKINEKNESNMTPLLLASASGHSDIAAILLENKADVKNADNNKRTALHYAAYCGQEAVVKEVIKYVKSVNDKDAFSYSPIDYAINANQDNIVGLLALKEPKLSADAENQQLVFLGNISRDNYNTVSLLLDHKARADKELYGAIPLVVAAGSSSLKVVDLLINSGAELNKPDEKAFTPLLSACLTGRPEVVKYLLDKGAKVNVKSKTGLSAVEAAVLRNDPEMIDLLISKGVDIETKDSSGKTPFWIAAMLGHRKSMKKLLDAGAQCNLDHDNAIDLMEVAFRYDMPEAVELALNQCLNADFMFHEKYPSTWVAKYYGSDEILQHLIDHGAVKDDGEGLGFVKTEDLAEKPKIIEATPIYYPLDLKRKYGSRKFQVKVVIDEQGRVLFPKMVESSIPELDRIIMATITKWRFTPSKNAAGGACPIIANLPVLLECEEIEKETWELSEVDKPSRMISAYPPKYPPDYRKQGITGNVKLQIIIDENGIPEDIKIVSLTHKGFADAAIEAAKQYKFSPAYYQGKPVKIRVKLPIVFDLYQ